LSGVDLDEKAVCGTCIGNKFLSQKISASETTDVACDYCGRNAPTLGLDEIAQIFDHEFQDNYQVADNVLREDHGYPSLGDELQEIIQQEVEPASHALSDDLFEIVRAIWERDAYDGQAPEADALFIKTGVADHWLHRRWHDMQESLRTRTRFVNPDALEVLQMVFDKVDKDVTASGEPLIVEVGPGHELGTLFRARVFQNDDALEKALEDPDAQLGPPPSGVGGAGRMNARGISMFYGANSPDVAIAEVRPPVGSRVAIAEFKILRSIRLLDLTRLPQIPSVINRSMFDASSLEIARRQKFLSQLERVLTKPVLPEHSEDGYLLTQVISDYLATHAKLNLDGLIFRSAQVPAPENRRPLNVTLFNKASFVKRFFKRHGRELNAYLYETDDEGDQWFHPQVWYKEDPASLNDDWDFLEKTDSTLELVPQSIVICEIKGISYDIRKSEVQLMDVSERT